MHLGLLFLTILPFYRLAAQERTDSRLQHAIDSLVTGFHGTVGIYVRHLPTGRTVAFNADSVFPTASMIKLPILVATFDAIERGQLDFRQGTPLHRLVALRG